MTITWEPQMALGVEELDQDHKNLISCLNDISTEVKKNPVDDMAVEAVIRRLLRYVNEHFAREEQWQHEIGYPEVIRHAGIHAAAARQVEELALDYFTYPDRETAFRVHGFLGAWLINHILKEDLKIRAWKEGRLKNAGM